MALALGFCALFTDASSQQSVEDCLARMEPPILRKTGALTNQRTPGKARIEHVLYGNKGQVTRLAKSFEQKGWQTSVEPMDEVGWGAFISESFGSFASNASQRVREMCTLAERSRVRYESWWLKAGGQTDYVSQSSRDATVTEDLRSE